MASITVGVATISGRIDAITATIIDLSRAMLHAPRESTYNKRPQFMTI
jgi:hypothetical protein